MQVIRSSSRATKVADPAQFTGTVFHDTIAIGEAPSRLRATLVTFTPGARTAWHSHSLGQVLYVTQGRGRVQCRGEAVQEIGAGDTVVIPPDTDHWHGAAADHLFSHIAITEVAGTGTQWKNHTSAEEYAVSVAPA